MNDSNQPKQQKSLEEIEELLNNNPLWAFVYQMATTGRPLRDIEIIALLEKNGLREVSSAAISMIRKELGIAKVSKGKVALAESLKPQ